MRWYEVPKVYRMAMDEMELELGGLCIGFVKMCWRDVREGGKRMWRKLVGRDVQEGRQ